MLEKSQNREMEGKQEFSGRLGAKGGIIYLSGGENK